MCDHCLQSPCHPRCPNASEPPLFANCVGCGAEIYDGDAYYEVDGDPYCEACVHYRTAEVDYD